MKENSNLLPFIKELPLDSDEYFKILSETETTTMRSGLVTLKKGENVGAHSTNNYEEMLVILSGIGELENNKFKKRLSIKKGDIAYIPPHTVHNVYNIGESILKYIYIVVKAK